MQKKVNKHFHSLWLCFVWLVNRWLTLTEQNGTNPPPPAPLSEEAGWRGGFSKDAR